MDRTPTGKLFVSPGIAGSDTKRLLFIVKPSTPCPPLFINGKDSSLNAIAISLVPAGIPVIFSGGVEPLPPCREHCCPSGISWPFQAASDSHASIPAWDEVEKTETHPVNKTTNSQCFILNLHIYETFLGVESSKRCACQWRKFVNKNSET